MNSTALKLVGTNEYPLTNAIGDFAEFLMVECGRGPETTRAYLGDLDNFLDFLGEVTPNDIQLNDIRRFLRDLTDKGLSAATIGRKLSTLREFFKLGKRNGWMKHLPTDGVRAPKRPDRLPHFLNFEAVKSLLAAPDRSRIGLRDRAILQLLYASGVRVSELVGLDVSDVDLEAGTIRVVGKGDRERFACVHPEAVQAIREWLRVKGESEALFVSLTGSRLSDRSARRVLDKHVKAAGLDPKTSPHTLRHSFATHVLEGGADLRDVQVLMGHQAIQSTTIYTHVTAQRKKAVYTKYHPMAAGE